MPTEVLINLGQLTNIQGMETKLSARSVKQVLAVACLAAAASFMVGPASPAYADDVRERAMIAAESAPGNGDRAALKAAKTQAAAALLYCNDQYTYFTTGPSRYTLIPQYEDFRQATQRCYLERGTRGVGVSRLQATLASCYGKAIAVDGAFGNATYNALLQVQRQIGVTIDGVYGPNTGKAMLHGPDGCRRVPSGIFDL